MSEKARRELAESALASARDDVERLETALTAAAHERDRKAEQARLATDGIAVLEQRVERLKQSLERERAEAERELERHAGEAEKKLERSEADAERKLAEARNVAEGALAKLENERNTAQREAERTAKETERLERALAEARRGLEGKEQGLEEKERSLEETRQAAQNAEQELATTRSRLEAREEHLENKRLGIESRDRKLKTAEESLTAHRTELATLHTKLEAREHELGETRQRLAEEESDVEELRKAARDAEQELATTRSRLEAREEHLERTQIAARETQHELNAISQRIIDREKELEAAATLLEAQGAELAAARNTIRDKEGKLERALQDARELEAELGKARARLETRERHMENKRLGIRSRDRRLEAADRALEARDAELERLRTAGRHHERELALAEQRLATAEKRAERFKGSLVELRGARAYRLMRIVWRLRHPFRRASRDAAAQPSDEDTDSSPEPAGPSAAPASPTSTSRASIPSQSAPRSSTSERPVPPTPPATRAQLSARSPSPPGRNSRDRLRIASILDEISEACFAPECDLVPLARDNWAEQLDERRPDLLLVESAWSGNGGAWQYRVASYPRADLAGVSALRALLEACHERAIPTAFWNKEDPIHFERFSEAASLFEHVFTTDAACIERYRALPGERTVTALPFAAQPRIHNPAAVVPERSGSPCFAGAWYRDRHPDRRRSLAALLDAARPRGLVIYDRSFGGKDGIFNFPERFAPHVLGKLPYERILDVYKSHEVFLNANSVADSPTMCSRRIFELAACDTAILSTPGDALRALLGEGMVDEASDEQTAAAALERLLGDEPERRRRTRAARRKVFASHTYAERLATIAETAGLDAPSRNGDDWKLIVQSGVELSDEARADLRAASVFAEADVIGAHPGNGAAPLEHRPADDLDPRALLLRRDLVAGRGLPSDDPEQISAQLRRWSEQGVRLYAADADLLTAGDRPATAI